LGWRRRPALARRDVELRVEPKRRACPPGRPVADRLGATDAARCGRVVPERNVRLRRDEVDAHRFGARSQRGLAGAASADLLEARAVAVLADAAAGAVEVVVPRVAGAVALGA